MQQGWLAFESATSAAASGDMHRSVQQLRRMLTYVTMADDAVLVCRANERLAYYLLEIGAYADAVAAAHAAIHALPEEPPRWERARSLATYAQTLLTADDLSPARTWALAARDAAKAAAAQSAEADALVTLGQLEERGGRTSGARARFTEAHRQDPEARVRVRRLGAAVQAD